LPGEQAWQERVPRQTDRWLALAPAWHPERRVLSLEAAWLASRSRACQSRRKDRWLDAVTEHRGLALESWASLRLELRPQQERQRDQRQQEQECHRREPPRGHCRLVLVWSVVSQEPPRMDRLPERLVLRELASPQALAFPQRVSRELPRTDRLLPELVQQVQLPGLELQELELLEHQTDRSQQVLLEWQVLRPEPE
jgi:hypothetical protein